MLLTPVTDAVKASVVANKVGGKINQVKLSKDVIDWLCKVKDRRVYMIGLAADFYLSTYLQDIVLKRIGGEPGFDPTTGYDYYIVNDVNTNALIGALRDTAQRAITWQDSFLFTYLCAAVAGELRHCPSGTPDEMRMKLKSFEILGSGGYKDASRSEVQKRFLQTIKMDRVREFLVLAVDVFRNGHWPGGYGGPKWADIAETGLHRFDNKLNESQFIDRVYDLKHNGGPIFDKNKAVDNSNLQSFLNDKFEAKTDADWNQWLKFLSADVRNFIVGAFELNVWTGKKPTGNAFKAITGGDEYNDSSSVDDDNGSSDDDDSSSSEPDGPSHEEKITFKFPKLNTSINTEKCPSGHEMVLDVIPNVPIQV